MARVAQNFLITSIYLFFCANLSAIRLEKFQIDEKTNNIEIKMENFESQNGKQQKDVLLDSKIYREIVDEQGNYHWIEDDANYSYSPYISYSVNNENPYIKIQWIAPDPENPSKKFKIILIEKNSDSNNSDKIICEKVFTIPN